MIDHVAEQRRQNYLDFLYIESGRTNNIYSGLYLERLRKLVEDDMNANLHHDNMDCRSTTSQS